MSIEDYEQCGATILRGVLDSPWVALGRRAIERALTDPGPMHREMASRGRFFNGFFHWLRDPEMRSLILDSPLPELASRFLAPAGVRFFYDQLFVKEPDTLEVTPWHQDLPYWPVHHGSIVSLWVPFDSVTEESGRMYFISGSHRWNEQNLIVPRAFAHRPSLPSPGESSSTYSVLSWDLEPGDCIAFHPLVVHCAGGNRTSGRRRRALSTRWADTNVLYAPHAESIFESYCEVVPAHELVPGEPLSGALFPRVWPAK